MRQSQIGTLRDKQRHAGQGSVSATEEATLNELADSNTRTETGLTQPEAEKLKAPESTPPDEAHIQSEPAAALEISARVGLVACLLELIHYRDLFWTLTLREIKVRYSQTVLGIAWAIAQPLALMLTFTVFFGKLAHVPNESSPYALFYFSALLPWTFFATSLSFGVSSLVSNTTLITKVYFPKEILPLACICSAVVDFIAASLVFILLMIKYGALIIAPWTLAALLPILFIQVTFTAAVTLILAATNVYYRDVRYALPLLMQVWLFASPVIYPVSVVPEWIRTPYLVLNPIAMTIEGYRSILVTHKPLPPSSVALTAVLSLLTLALSYAFFKRAERRFADVI